MIGKSYQIVSFEDYGNGMCEGSWGWSNGEQRTGGVRGQSQDREKNKGRSAHRASANVRRICMRLGLDHLLTLTYRANEKNKSKAFIDVAKFVRLVHEYLPEWKYVIVPEYQKRGAIHFHAGVKGYQNVKLLRTLWLQVIGSGNIDVAAPIEYRKDSKRKLARTTTWSPVNLSKYLAKYVSKAMGDNELNEQSYHASKNVKKFIKKIVIPFPFKAKEYLVYKIEQLAGKVGFIWESEESKGWYGWACSWD